ncbi:MAG: isopentenyl phosphate kinase family protein [Candidatus Methanoperedens sp.]|nr:isopentenyl phosphate kinase family protein [Candidatus Methanoperedens sp.]
MNLIILKIGGSVITEKGSISRAREAEIDRISHEIATFRKDSDSRIILVHGAGSFGHPQAMKYRLNDGFDAQGAYLTHVSVKLLNSRVMESLNNAGVNALPVHPMSACLLENGKLIDFQLGQIKVMIEKGIVPVLHGDVAMDRTKGASVLSGDRIIPYLALSLKASKIGAGSDVDGVLDEKEAVIRKITPFSFMDLKKSIKGSGSTDVTGGMLGKVSELLELAGKGVDSRIFNATKKGMVSRFLYGEDVGTLISDK